jgi:hypothetical protein
LAAQALAKEGNTLLLPAAMNDPAGMVAQAMSIYGTVSKQQGFGGGNRCCSTLFTSDPSRVGYSSGRLQLAQVHLSGC